MPLLRHARIACLFLLAVPAVSGARPAVAPPPSVAPFTAAFTLPRAEEARLWLTASAPGCEWGRAGAESAVVTVFVDGERNQEVVLYAGEERHTYDLMLGPLPAGRHTLSVTYRPDLSPKGATGARVERAEVRPAGGDERERLAWRHAPLL